jgi:hypothetical protein
MSAPEKRAKSASEEVKFPPPMPRHRSLRFPILDRVLFDYMPKELVGIVDNYCSAAPIYHPERLLGLDYPASNFPLGGCWSVRRLINGIMFYKNGEPLWDNPIDTIFLVSVENVYIDESTDCLLLYSAGRSVRFSLSTGQIRCDEVSIPAHRFFETGISYNKYGDTVKLLGPDLELLVDTGLPVGASFTGATREWTSRMCEDKQKGFHLALFPKGAQEIHFPSIGELSRLAPDWVQIVGDYVILLMWQKYQTGLCVFSISTGLLLWKNLDITVLNHMVVPGPVILIESSTNIVALDLATGVLLETYEDTALVKISRDAFLYRNHLIAPFEFVYAE